MIRRAHRRLIVPVAILLFLGSGLLSACGGSNSLETVAGDPLVLPTVTPVAAGERLQVVATTSIIGDVVRRVGGEAIDLTVLMRPGQDPHSYQPGAADLTAAADADLIFINGWNLEEGLVDDLATISGGAALVPISAGVEPLTLGENGDSHAGEDRAHGAADPHTWQDVRNVIQWVENVRSVLGAADPAHAATYDANAAAYRSELEQLDEEIRALVASIPDDRRVLVTNHHSLDYFAAAYGFRVLGAVIPSTSTLAEPTAAGLATLVSTMEAAGVCALFVDQTTSDQLARTLASELRGCDEVRVLPLYTGAVGPVGSGADSYVGMMRANVATLLDGLAS